MNRRYYGLAGLAAMGLLVAACSSSSTATTGSGSAPSSSAAPANSAAPATSAGSNAAASGTTLSSKTIGGATLLTNDKGFTLYTFVPDTATASKCYGSCATYWPPVKGPATAGTGVTGTLGTITRTDGTKQVTWNGHPLYTYVGDTAPGQDKGNNLNLSGGVWHVVTLSGSDPAPASSSSSSSGGYGYLRTRYLTIAAAGNRRLEHDFDRFDGPDRANLARAEADLRDIAQTERLFDQRLQRIPFPPPVETFAGLLVSANQARISLTGSAAGSASLSQLAGYRARLRAADAPVELAVGIIRARLGLPPSDVS